MSFSNAQEAKYYNFNVKIKPSSKHIYVKGKMELDFKDKDSIVFVFWKNSKINSLTNNEDTVKYFFNQASPSPAMYIPEGRKLVFYKEEGTPQIQTLYIDYECDMSELKGWGVSFNEKWIELNYYCAWYPVCRTGSSITSQLKISIDEKYKVSGSGIVEKQDDYWLMKQDWNSFDNVIVASKKLNIKSVKDEKMKIDVVFSDLTEKDTDSVITGCKDVLSFYRNIFGTKDSTYLKFVVAPINKGGGYSRKHFVSFGSTQFDLYTIGGIAHEIAHFWWLKANTNTWEDWLNESFAEYSQLMFLREKYGNEVFTNKINDYEKNSKNTPSVWEADRNSNEAYKVFYFKGSLILYELEKKLGKEKFYRFMKIVADNEVSTTSCLLELIKQNFNEEVSFWLETELKTR